MKIEVSSTEPPKEVIAPTINIAIEGDLRENHRVDFILDIQRGTKELNMSTLDISFNTTDYLPYIKPTTTEFSRVFSNNGNKTVTVKIKATDGTEYTETKTFNIGVDNPSNANFNISGDGSRNEEGFATFTVTDTSNPTDDEIGTISYFYEDTAYIEEVDGSFSPNGTTYYELEPNEAGEFKISKLGTTNIKQVVEDYYYNGIGLDGYDLDQYRQFKTNEKIIPITVINQTPSLEYEVFPNVIVKGQSIEHITNVTDDTIAGDEVEYRFTHDYNYYQNSDGEHTLNNIIEDEPLKIINKKGKYTFEARVKDEDGEYSNWVNGGIVYVVSEPVADFELGGTGEVEDDVFRAGSQIVFNNLAKNDDYGQTVSNHGIKYMKIEYRNITNNNWNTVFELDNLPNYFFTINMPVIDNIGEYEIKQTIISVDGIEASITKKFTIMDLRLDAELEPSTIYASQSYKIKATTSLDCQGVVAKDHKGNWITLSKVNEDTDNKYYEKTISTLETLADTDYNIEVYAQYPFANEVREDLNLVVDTPITVDLTLNPNREAASEKINIQAITNCKVEPVDVTIAVDGETPFELTKGPKVGDEITWTGTFTIPSNKSDGIYNVEAKAELPNGNKGYDDANLTVNTPINLDPYINDKNSDITLIEDDNFTVKVNASKYTKEVYVKFPFDVMDETETITYPANTEIQLAGTLGDEVFTKNLYLPTSGLDENTTYQAEFKGVACNNKEETKALDFKALSLKLENLRVYKIADFNWQSYFENEDGNPTSLQTDGIKVKDMPIFSNNESNGIKMGYKTYFKIDSKGLSGPNDTIKINAKFYGLKEDMTLSEVDVWVEDDNSGEYKLLENSDYKNIAKEIVLDSSSREPSEIDPSNLSANTWSFDYFLPPTTKVVKKGEPLDLIDDNTYKYKLLILFEIIGEKETGTTYNYTTKESNWGNDNGSIYGQNLPTGLDLGYGTNHGEVFYYNLYDSFLDDFKLYKEW